MDKKAGIKRYGYTSNQTLCSYFFRNKKSLVYLSASGFADQIINKNDTKQKELRTKTWKQ